MNVKLSGAKYSAIVAIGEEIKKLEKETGRKYLSLNRGVNAVVKINLNSIAQKLDYQTSEMQIYAPTTGMPLLKEAINNEYFANKTQKENIMVTGGGMHALNIVLQSLKLEKIYSHAMFWGAYSNIFKILNIKHNFYSRYEKLLENPEKYSNSAVIICDPNNPVGNKYPDEKLLNIVSVLEKHNATVIWDGPYRRLFNNKTDDIYKKLLQFKNVIITESFSKSIGLSGLRTGFIHTQNEELNKEIAVRILYSCNGVCAFSQILIEKLLSTDEGKQICEEFKEKTTTDIKKNIKYLKDKKLLAVEFYQKSTPVGIFVIVNKSSEQLLKKRIGSVPLNFFTKRTDIDVSNFSRICVSVPTEKFISFFENI